VAEKSIPCADERGAKHVPSSVNGVKLEMFVFDSFCLAKNMVAFAVPREGEFTPVKNKAGVDSPDSARADLSAYHRKLLLAAGAEVPAGAAAANTDAGLLELSPLLTYDGEGLEWAKGKTFSPPRYIATDK
jgi:UDP-N-acetylglucosamine/UDP-N-acetylgalactosamine diphosphorylase